MKKIYYLLLVTFLTPTLLMAQPANDDCSGALPIEIDGAAVTADNTDATISGPNGTCFFGDQVDGDVWFSLSVTEATSIIIQTEAGTADDSQLALFTIEDCGSGSEVYTEIACNDDMGFFDPMSEILIEDIAPGSYYLRASTYGEDNSGTYSVSVVSFDLPENDSCEGAIELIVDGPAETADNSYATIVGPEGSCYSIAQAAGDTWFSFTTTETMNIQVLAEEIEGGSIDSQVAVFSIEGCGTEDEVYTEIGCGEDISSDNYMSSALLIDLEPGTYYVKAGTYSSFFTGAYEISVNTYGDVPANSLCSGAVVQDLTIDGATVTVTGSGTNAVDVAGLGQAHVWEAFTITECADVTVDMCGTSVVPSNFYVSLINGCPVQISEETLFSTEDFNTTTCANDTNMTATFTALPAGTYYYPVMSSPNYTVLDEYTVNFTAVACEVILEPDTCLEYSAGPWNDFNTIFGGAPGPDALGICEVNQITEFEVYASESYVIDSFAANVAYTFSICEGGSAGAWSPALSVTDPNGVVVAYVEDCSVTWVTEIEGTYTIGISEAGACYNSANTDVSNGFPTLTCQGGMGVSEVDNANFSIFPNPNNGQFSIRNAGLTGDYIVEMIDLSGRTIHTQASVLNANSVTEVSTDKVAPGVYMIRMTNTKDNSFVTKRIVVQ